MKQVQSSDGNGVLLTTGASDTCKKMNIYDLAGNVWEWTLEYSSNIDIPCALRGGSLLYTGSKYPTSYRNSHMMDWSVVDFGFRLSLYK